MKYCFILFSVFLTLFFSSCSQKTTADINPPAPGFDLEASDTKAIALADAVMKAQGGRQAWDQTRYLDWNFFGRRRLLWDKQANRVRIEIPADTTIMLLDMNAMKGRVLLKGEEQSHPDSLRKYLQRAKEIWINDSYWLVMPFKLKDTGVTLKYIGERKDTKDRPCEVVQLTFSGVGVTPDNKYEVYIDQETKLVCQWAFFRAYSHDEPAFITPWDNYQTYGKIQLADGRGKGKMESIKVDGAVEEKVFLEF